MTKGILLEKSRDELISKSKRVSKGLQRYKRRVKSSISTNTQRYNNIDMDKLFRKDILDISIEVIGETDTYTVKISFGGVLDKIQELLNKNNKKDIDLSLIIKALVTTFNNNDVYVNCDCPDFIYRYSYVSTKDNYKNGTPELRPANVRNPDDNLGSACKHVLLVLANTYWLIKVASVINNYVKYFKTSRQKQYAEIIYPALYGKKYDKHVQQSIFDDTEENNDLKNTEVINRKGSSLGRGRKPSK